MRNRLMRHDGGDGPSTPRFAYGTQEFLAWRNQNCSRPDVIWFYDTAGNMQLRYRKRGD
jgi:hypothetical protein